MSFGVVIESAIFQSYIKFVLQDYLNILFIPYFDNILINSFGPKDS